MPRPGRTRHVTGNILESSDLMNVHRTMSFFSPLMTAVFKPKLIHKKSLQDDSLGLMMNWNSLQGICCDEKPPLLPRQRPKILLVFDQKDKSVLCLLTSNHHLSDSWNIMTGTGHTPVGSHWHGPNIPLESIHMVTCGGVVSCSTNTPVCLPWCQTAI